MLVIRLTRVGKKNSPSFRVVVADKKKAVKRKFIEILGHYNPSSTPKQLVIDKEKALHWISLGAQPSDTVNNLMVGLDILPKDKMVAKTYGKATKKKDGGSEPEKAAVVAETAETESAEDAPAETEEVAETETTEETPATEEITETTEEK